MLEAIKIRRSVRKYKTGEIPEDMVITMLEAARYAPTAGNLQPWFFYVVRGRGHREALAACALNQRFIAQAPVVFVVCAEPERAARVYGARGRDLYCIQDTAAAGENLLLTAAALGLGSCWVGSFDEQKVKEYLKMPDCRRPVAIIPVGYPEYQGEGRTDRRGIEEITSFL